MDNELLEKLDIITKDLNDSDEVKEMLILKKRIFLGRKMA